MNSRVIKREKIYIQCRSEIKEGGKGGSRSRFTENKTVLSQFTKNNDMMKITVHGELNIYFAFHGK